MKVVSLCFFLLNSQQPVSCQKFYFVYYYYSYARNNIYYIEIEDRVLNFDICTQEVHCPTCRILPTSDWLKDNELALHGCCGREVCDAYHPVEQQDLLAPILDRAIVQGEDNEARRHYVYRAWCTVATREGLLPDRFSYTSDNKIRYRWSSCILHRVRCTYPSREYTGFVANYSRFPSKNGLN